MQYTDIEKQTLDMLQRTDFKNISKNEVVSIFSQLSQLRPEVATEVLAQFPEFVKLVQSSMSEYKEMLSNIIASDDESLKQVFSVADKDLDNAAKSRQQFYDMAGKVHADLSKCLDNPNLTPEERKDILAQEIEILKAVDEKDSEKRQFNWGAIKVASTVLVIGLGIGASILGGNVNIKLPKKV